MIKTKQQNFTSKLKKKKRLLSQKSKFFEKNISKLITVKKKR